MVHYITLSLRFNYLEFMSHQMGRSKTDQITSQMSSQKEGRMRQERKNNGQENNASIIPIVKEELTAFPERLSGNQP